MFSIKTTSGSITIVLADALLSYVVFWLFLFILSSHPEWLASDSLYRHHTYIIFTLIIILSLSFAGFYSFREHIYPFEMLKQIIPAFLLSFGAIATLGLFIKGITLLQWRLFPPLGIIYSLVFILRTFQFYILSKNRERILILGATDQSREIIKEARSKKLRGYEIVGIATSRESEVKSVFQDIPVLGHMDQLDNILRDNAINSIVVTLRDRRGKLPVRELLKSKMANITVQEGVTFYEKVKRKIIIDEFLKPSWFIFENGFCHTSLHGSIKRTQGVTVSFILLSILSPVLILVCVLIKLDSPGPFFFLQERIGLNGTIFNLIKFRSMTHEAESRTGPVFAQKNDPRVTRVGRIIRKIRLDEIPQLINIFKGDMDMVGPRPERPVFVKQLRESVPYYELRHTVRPGLTGWAQVNYPYGASIEDGKEKLQYDLYYVKHFSWHMDLLIILLTIKEVLFGGGR
ncbi:MAG: TIGR03013 family PEP-CTERM/XrtA system glycosyltransferase [Deltaproteobacteria bacterium]|nr:TIGR03013 family PEP-CTERM/XrtA system glycosyltransferase [Deltaproteobacteria bacterium]